MSEILDTNSELATVVRAIKLLELLRAEGLPAAKAVKPLSKFTSSQREYLQQRLRFVADQHVEAAVALRAMGVRRRTGPICAALRRLLAQGRWTLSACAADGHCTQC